MRPQVPEYPTDAVRNVRNFQRLIYGLRKLRIPGTTDHVFHIVVEREEQVIASSARQAVLRAVAGRKIDQHLVEHS